MRKQYRETGRKEYSLSFRSDFSFFFCEDVVGNNHCSAEESSSPQIDYVVASVKIDIFLSLSLSLAKNLTKRRHTIRTCQDEADTSSATRDENLEKLQLLLSFSFFLSLLFLL